MLRVDFVDAQRNIDDENATRSNKLSEAFAAYYQRNLEQAEAAEEAVAVIEENNQNLTAHYQQGISKNCPDPAAGIESGGYAAAGV
ncbi:hypothetical protein [Rhodobacter capsulatus]|uniref:hypothetical protein n=1 Tax=Rhodobacter capsulatus TaxID=1061 RepID=UPI004029C7C0